MCKKTKFLKNIHYLRGFAIICIIVVHIWRIPPSYIDYDSIYLKFVNNIRELLFHDSAIYFIFISGFLLNYLSLKFNTATFYKSKLKKIVSPYLVMTTSVLIIQYICHHGDDITFSKLVNYYIFGKAQTQYWYIPFICVVFMISPILLKIPKYKLSLLFPLFIILPLFGTRTGTSISIGQYLYFLPIYILGIICSINHNKFVSFVNRHIIKFIILIVISTFLILFIKIYSLNNHFINLYESSQYIQKMLILSVLFVFFEKIEHIDIPTLDLLARYSYTLYFTHYLVYTYILQKFYILFNVSSFLIIPLSIFYTIIGIFLTLLLCVFIKKILGAKSKYIIGT